MLLIITGSGTHLFILSVKLVFHLIALTIEGIDSTHQQVTGDILQMSAVLQPRSCLRYMIRRTLTLGLDQQWHVYEILAVPGLERLQSLQALTRR